MSTAIKKQFTVKAPPERAFRMFTAGIDRWWPREHHIGTSPLKELLIEPKQGGRWYAKCVDGSECDTGRVVVWEPPSRLVLTWQITAQWKFDPQFVTEIEVRFTPEGNKHTRVDFEHRNMDRYGDAAAGILSQLDNPKGGWGGVLQAFATTAAEEFVKEDPFVLNGVVSSSTIRDWNETILP